MNVTAEYVDGVKFEVSARGHKVFTDQPDGEAGLDRGMTPPELLLASVASCAAHYALMYLQARQLPTAGLRVHVRAEKVKGPARLTNFEIEVELGELPERHKEGVLRAMHSCLVHNTLVHTPEIAFRVSAKEPTLA